MFGYREASVGVLQLVGTSSELADAGPGPLPFRWELSRFRVAEVRAQSQLRAARYSW